MKKLDLATELSRPVDSSARDLWYNVEAGYYIDEALSLGLEEQGRSAASTPAQDSSRSPSSSHGSSPHQINEYNDGIARSMPEEPVGHYPKLQDEAVKATRDQDNDNKPDQQREKGQPQSVAKGTRYISKAMDDDDKEPRPAKRRRSSTESRAPENSPLENSKAQFQTEHGASTNPSRPRASFYKVSKTPLPCCGASTCGRVSGVGLHRIPEVYHCRQRKDI